ncbi:MAG TPA: hypothetical protein VES93_14470, partial [Ornithinibacter sp.]|nr:hypothetical protein [Ornithinibacter sp.]
TLRHDNPLVVDGRFELLLPDHPQLWVIVRAAEGGEGAVGGDVPCLVVVANCSSVPATADAADLPDLSSATVLLATHPGRTGLDLLPWESRVLEIGAPSSR